MDIWKELDEAQSDSTTLAQIDHFIMAILEVMKKLAPEPNVAASALMDVLCAGLATFVRNEYVIKKTVVHFEELLRINVAHAQEIIKKTNEEDTHDG